MIIYKIENKINGKIYIGQTTKDVQQRISTHMKINKYYIQKSLNKYGLDSFTISVIDQADSQNSLDEKEKYWISFYDCRAPKGYNCTAGGDGVRGYKHTEEAIEKNREAHLGKRVSDETRLKMSKAHKGKKLSSEHKANISIAKKGMILSEETRRKLSVLRSEKNRLNYGRRLSDETKRKIGEANSKYRPSEEQKQRLRELNTGKHPSLETRQKMKESGMIAWKKRKERLAA